MGVYTELLKEAMECISDGVIDTRYSLGEQGVEVIVVAYE